MSPVNPYLQAVWAEMRRQIDAGVQSGIDPIHVHNHMMVATCELLWLLNVVQASRCCSDNRA
jgi:hypothetical protein